ncbi:MULTISPECIES: hypothetical protein [Methanoculleus]|uniref:Uncharacterized protein n=1 Tax=Methanoculleus submarinus TaxID=204050 RepID=A0AAX3E7F7_9EURY|nr:MULTISPECIES: hypothetical protein [Methanoculleus]MCC7555796.1 hypothetical protein [Methanoculleus marisnigri]UYU17831.1 hypothetical protein OH143_08955 [Methanoculleus submarinus]
MSETEGRFEQGRWVVDPAPAPEEEPAPEAEPAPDAPTVEERVQGASESVRKAVNDVVNAGQHLFGTPEGHEHIQQAARKTGEDLERAISAWADSARRALKRQQGNP